MKDRRCWATGKRQFKNQADAARAVAHFLRLAVPGLEQTAQTTYRCHHCRKWHITGQSPQQAREFRAMREGRGA